MTDWVGKYAGATARLAGNIHAATHLDKAADHPVTGETFTAARQLGNYFLAHATAAYDQMGTNTDLDDASVILDWIQRTQPSHFTRRDIHAAHRRRFATAAAIDPALDILEERGHIARAAEPEQRGPGRPRVATYWPHPLYRQPDDRPS